MTGRRRGPPGLVEPIDHGTAELRPDPERVGGWLLLVDGHPQSYVDPEDPAYLDFEYMRRLASIVDSMAPAGAPLRVLHLGGGACTLARYVAVTRPRSQQRVVDRDAALIALVRRVLPLPKGADIRVRPEDARVAAEAAAPARFDLVVTDVFGGARVPGRCATVEFVRAAAKALRPGGVYAANLADGPPLGFARRQVATLREVFGDVCLLAEPGVLRGRRFGNVILVGALAPERLPLAALAGAAARDPFPARLLTGDDLTRFQAGAKPVWDAAPEESPPPPRALFA